VRSGTDRPRPTRPVGSIAGLQHDQAERGCWTSISAISKPPSKPLQQTLYFAGVVVISGVLLALGQSWAIGPLVVGCAGLVVLGARAWRRYRSNPPAALAPDEKSD